MNKHSAALILPYYGKFPNYFPLWLKSAGANPDFTFMIFTDIDMSGYDIPKNVQVHYLTFEGVKKLIAPHLDFDFVCGTPYKLCDYRPIFGLIFVDYLAGYDFWGFCDSDVIFGDLGKYITDDILDRYGKLFCKGHLQLLRNTEDVKYFALHKLPYWNISYRDIFRTSEHMFYEESALCELLFYEYTYGA